MSHVNRIGPDFIIAGGAKSGTTALHYMLDQHPQIFMSSIKETNFFVYRYEPFRHYREHCGVTSAHDVGDEDICDTDEKYLACFDGAAADQVLGESSPWYLINGNVPERIAKFRRDTKIIVMLRNPTDVVFANFVHQVREGMESVQLDGIEEILNEERYRAEDLHPFARHLDIPSYAKHLAAFQSVFDPAQFMVVIYEEFLEDKDRFLDEIAFFLGVEPGRTIDSGKRVNKSGLPRSRWMQGAIKGDGIVKRAISACVPKKPRRYLRARLEAWNTSSKPMLDPALRTRLDDRFEADRAYVEGLLGRKVSAWP